jgi:hypothetical protein
MDGLVVYEVLPNLEDKRREAYYCLLEGAANIEGLCLNRFRYCKVVLEEPSKRWFSHPKIVAVVESDSPLGDLDGMTNEETAGGFNNRRYEGLQIYLLEERYASKIDNVAKIMGEITKEPVRVENRIPSKKSILKEIAPKY